MVTLAVAIVIVAVGIPALTTLTTRDISVATVNGLVTALQQARTEAVTRGLNVQLLSNPKGWNHGWTVELETAANGEKVLRVFDAPRAELVAIGGVVSPITFNSRGETPANSVFTVSAYKTADKTGAAVRVRFVCVTRTGQIRAEETNNCPT
jgi:type IV fimbrial biogenesis protein FimT